MSAKLMKMVKACAVLAACAFTSSTVTADIVQYGGYTWTYSISGSYATIGTGAYNQMAISPNPTGSLALPPSLGGKTVSTLGTGAFWEAGLTGISSWGYITTIGNYAFGSCKSLKSVTIPDAVTSVGKQAFWDCDNLTTLNVGDGITTIPDSFASSCEKLSNLTIGKNVTKIDQFAFAGDKALKYVTIPKKVTTLAAKAFNGCSNLHVAYVPIALKDKFIASEVFSNCAADFKVIYYGSETTGGYTWGYQLYDNGDQVVASVSPAPSGAVTVPAKLGGYDVTGVGAFLFQDDDGITSVTIPGTVTSIGECAFAGCSGLATVTLPNSVTTIGPDAFAGCLSLEEVVIPANVTSIGTKAFNGCSNLKTAYVPISLKDKFTVSDVFAGVASDFEIRYYGTAEEGWYTWYFYLDAEGGAVLSGYPFGRTTAISLLDEMRFNLVIPAEIGGYAVTGIGAFAFYEVGGFKYVTVPDGVTTIEEFAFAKCPDMDTAVLPDTVTELADFAFANNPKLSYVSIPGRYYDSLAKFKVFDLCSPNLKITCKGYPWLRISNGVLLEVWDLNGLNVMRIPDGVTSIGARAFAGSKYVQAGLQGVEIPACVTNIDATAFRMSGNSGESSSEGGASYVLALKSFTVAKDNPNYKSVDGYLLTKDGKTLLKGVKNEDQTVIPDGVEKIADYAFYDLSVGSQGVKFPDSLLEIGYRAFAGIYLAVDMTIPVSVTTLCPGAFSDMVMKGTVKLPRHLEGAAAAAFVNCSGLKISYYDALYAIRFHRNDASDEKVESRDFPHGESTHLPSLAKLGWARKGCDFLGWATSRANADAGKVWKKDWAAVSSPVAAGKTLDVYAVWALKSDSYAIQFIRNDGAGTWRTVGFNYGEKTRMPSLANGLGWARRGYEFKGWALTTADAAAGKVWKGDWAYVATPVKAGEVLTVYAVWELKPGYYQIRFNKNDGTGKWRALGYEYGVSTKLPTVKALDWTVSGKRFKGWATSAANASAGKAWKSDGAAVSTAAAEGKTLSIYAIWE